MTRFNKLIYGGLFLILITIKSVFGIDVGAWFGVTADIDPETGAFLSTGLDKIVDGVLLVLGLIGIVKPKNAPAPGVAEVKVSELTSTAKTEVIAKAEATGAGLPDPVKN